MLQKVKSILRLLKNKWVNSRCWKKYCIVAAIIFIIIVGLDIGNPIVKEENYEEMYSMITEITEQKSTDVKFDTSKVNTYTVVHRKNGDKEITISGALLEEIQLTLTSDYQIKSLTKETNNIVWFWIEYVIFLAFIAIVDTMVLFEICNITKKIVLFMKK